MNMENFKTILLINLVAISLFLSYSLWTSQPASNSFQQQKYVQDDAVIAKKEVSDLIFPSRMIVHKGNAHIASEQNVYINDMYKALEQGEFHDFKDVSYKVSIKEFLSFVHGDNKTELEFTTDIPFDAMKSVFSIKDKGLSNYSFDRIVINFDPGISHDDAIKTYFISYDKRKIYEMTLKGYKLKQLENIRNQFTAKGGKDYFMYRLDDARAVFLPEAEVALPSIPYVTSELPEEMFKNALFTDPRYVKKDETETEETYTDGTRLLQVNKGTQMLNYENSSVSSNEYVTAGLLVQRSINSINSHGGWTDSYRFHYVSPKKGETVFRLYADNSYPVFSEKEMASLKQTWGVEELSTYKRPLFKLLLKGEEEESTKLPSGRAVIALLEKMPNADMKNIKSIDFGYEMVPEVGMSGGKINVIKLKPIWFISYESAKNGQLYKKISWDTVKGGDLIGLE
ncbi:two-component system activity regulator YycH [Ectobacillus panaciterrae]|uniref:YycH family regulatory protein n=1 Tax=Ectobacillus panaciterrae TaxID=363872 RepID=UPI000408EF5C